MLSNIHFQYGLILVKLHLNVLVQVYSLIGGFCGSPVNFHAKDGSGYTFMGEMVLKLDKLNPQVCLLFPNIGQV